MLKISCYLTAQDKLTKSFTGIIEKCFLNKLRTIVITPSVHFGRDLDNTLWTYAKKKFIPHATSADPFPELQPIYITDQIENPNRASVAVFVNPDQNKIVTFFSEPDKTKLSEFTRIIYLFDETTGLNHQKIKDILDNLLSKIGHKVPQILEGYFIESFHQSASGEWHKN